MSDYEFQPILFGEAATNDPNFHDSKARSSMFHAIEALVEAGLVTTENNYLNITQRGVEVLSDPIPYWTEVCERKTDVEEAKMIKLVNNASQRYENDPECVWLEHVDGKTVLEAFDIALPSPETNEHMDELQKYLYVLPELLRKRNFLKALPRSGYHTELTPTYEGLVWETRKGFTIESKLIDGLVKDWETTNVDFKREIGLDTKKQKAEFAKDVLGLATTKSSGRRYLIVGFDDKTRGYHGAPDEKVTQDRMEQILANLTEPVVNIRYKVIDYKLGKVGKLEIIREPEKLPYCAATDVIVDDKGRKGLEKGKIYVRHGSQTESPTELELQALEDEGRRARGA